MLNKFIRFFLDNPLITVLFASGMIFWGVMVAPFDWDLDLPRSPVPVDAIPDIGENQQIVFTEWMGRSPQDIEDQVSYPLTVALLGIPEVKTVRSFSMFGFSSIYVVFKESAEFYWSRSRILEKLSSLPTGTLPEGVKPTMGPDATALGQVFWYTLEGVDTEGNPAGGWGLEELRSIQDWQVRYGLMAAEGVAEVASVGGYVKEYQVDVNPDKMRAYGVSLDQIYKAVKTSNLDVGARTVEINRVEYVIRGIGFVKSVEDLEKAVVAVNDNVPVRLSEVARVVEGPALRRGILDKEGAEAVGGVVVARYGENPLEVIENIKAKIDEISPGLPQKELADGSVSKVNIVPFYDRSGLIKETLGTLNNAIWLQVLVTVLVILILLRNLGSSLVISGVLPIAVLLSFIGMKLAGVDANIVSLSGIAIAIGTIVDMGIILSENILKRLKEAPEGADRKEVVFEAATEVAGAILTAVFTTVISFLPVFTMEAAEGKLFKPLAYTKTFALIASILVALTVLPPALYMLFGKKHHPHHKQIFSAIVGVIGVVLMFKVTWWLGLIVFFFGIKGELEEFIRSRSKAPALECRPEAPASRDRQTHSELEAEPRGTHSPRDAGNEKWWSRFANWLSLDSILNVAIISVVAILLASTWMPLGVGKGTLLNILFVVFVVGTLLLFFQLFIRFYPKMLNLFLKHKALLLVPVGLLILSGATIWLGFSTLFGWLPDPVQKWKPVAKLAHDYPGLGKEFMPPLDEGSYLYMPTTMTHASIGEVHDIIRLQDMAIAAIPEVEAAVGKLGRVESPLDPAPVSMIETIINIKPEYRVDEHGKRLRFRYEKGEFLRDEEGKLIPDPRGKPFRQWRDHIREADDIWDEIVNAAQIVGVTSAPKLQPIAARIVMLQSGMRAPMGIKVQGPDLATIESFGLQLEKYLKEVPTVQAAAVLADRIVGKPYLEIEIDRDAIARYGISIEQMQRTIDIALGGKTATTTVEGRERYNVRVRYPRELRGLGNGIEEIKEVLIAGAGGVQIPLKQLADIQYRRGPQVIKSEDTFLTGYVLFDKLGDQAEVDVVNHAKAYLQSKIESGELTIPNGVNYRFAGSYENQIRSEKRLMVILPVALFAIFMILYFQFKRISTTLLVFGGILVAWSGGFILIHLYGQEWFLNVSVFGENLRDLFQIHPINLSVAIWVGFLALFGIATDDGVVICTYLENRFRDQEISSKEQIRKLTVEAASRRVRPALMTSATTILALLPIFTATGRGADVMIPMAIPSFGGMMVALLTIFLTPVLYAILKEWELKRNKRG